MLTRDKFMTKNPDVKIGDTVFTKDGENLGKIVELMDDYLTIEKGFFFPKDFTIRYDNIAGFDEKNNIIVDFEKSEINEWRDEKYAGWQDYDKANYGEASFPLREEELEAHKVTRPKGEVRVRKVVHTEVKNLEIPVSREEVIIERTPAGKETDYRGSPNAFKDEEVVIPLSEEEVEVTKKQKVKEDVHIRKETKTDKERVKGDVRKEEVHVDR